MIFLKPHSNIQMLVTTEIDKFQAVSVWFNLFHRRISMTIAFLLNSECFLRISRHLKLHKFASSSAAATLILHRISYDVSLK